MELLAVVLALAAALSFAGAFVAQQHAAAGVPDGQGEGLRLYLRLARSPMWWAGALGDAAGFVLQAVALVFGSVVLVQPVLVTALIFALPLAARWNGRRVSRGDLCWAAVVVAGLAVFTVLADSTKESVSDAARPWIWPGAACVVACVGLFAAGWRTKGTVRAVAFGALAGMAYGIVAPLTELVMASLERTGPVGVLRSWPVYALLVWALAGTAWQQTAFHAGNLGASLPTTQVLEPVVAVGLGLWALGARLGTHGPAWLALGLAAAAMVVGTVRLARGAAQEGAPSPAGQ
ncbi:MAG: DMT family transporter [Bifidobacteriaceae bacterium]|jgi:drug/metabolite transporter (DMT)-like permease|nr:DMT family transporter [Bifidobacteriaceae bacterium]